MHPGVARHRIGAGGKMVVMQRVDIIGHPGAGGDLGMVRPNEIFVQIAHKKP